MYKELPKCSGNLNSTHKLDGICLPAARRSQQYAPWIIVSNKTRVLYISFQSRGYIFYSHISPPLEFLYDKVSITHITSCFVVDTAFCILIPLLLIQTIVICEFLIPSFSVLFQIYLRSASFPSTYPLSSYFIWHFVDTSIPSEPVYWFIPVCSY